MKKEHKISALKNGTVIDHIKSENTLKVLKILKLKNEQLTIGVNFESGKYDKKGVIKISEKELDPEELNKISFVTPKATIVIIKDYDVKKKSKLSVPKEYKGVAKCGNYNCITNFEPINTHFFTVSEEPIRVIRNLQKRILKE